MKCSFCNGENPEASVTCVHCGRSLGPAPGAWSEAGAARAPSAGAAPALIPYKNPLALTGYYLGVFSAIPCVGIPLGITAFVLGLLGLKRAKAHPESKGKVHAWVGIIVGGLFGFGYLVALIVLAAGLASSHWH
jgi:hypothetical protein